MKRYLKLDGHNLDMKSKKARLQKWLTLLLFLVAIIFLILLTKNKGSFSAAWDDLTGFLR